MDSPADTSVPRKLHLTWVQVLPWAAFVLLAGAGVWLLAFDMAKGPWAYSDSVEYIVSARSLATGHGLGIPGPDGRFMPLTLHPPLYPLMLAPLLALGADMWAAAGGLNLLFYTLSILLVGAGTYRLSRSLGWGLFSAALLVAAAPVVRSFDGAMSEPPFVFFSLLSLYLLAAGLNERRPGLLLGSALAAAAATLLRYIGLVSGALGVLAVLAFSGLALRKRWMQAGLYALVAWLPPVAWLLAGMASNGALASRTFRPSGELLGSLNDFRRAVIPLLVDWLPYEYKLPSWRWKAVALVGVGLVMVGLFALAWLRRKKSGGEGQAGGLLLWALAALYSVGYLAFLGFSYLFSSIQPDLIERTLMPLLPLLGLLGFGSVFLAIRSLRLPWYALAVPLALFVLVWNSYWPVTWHHVRQRNETGSGYSMEQWRQSALLGAVKQIRADVPLVSNQAAGVLLYTGRFPYELSEFATPLPPEAFTSFGQGSGPDEVAFREHCAALVLFEFDAVTQFERYYGKNTNERLAALTSGLQRAVQTPQGSIYYAPGCPVR